MTDLLRVIKNRRSVRSFDPAPLKKDDITRILEAGRWAPSGLNNQPWRFLVLSDKESKLTLSRFTAYASVIRKAASVILILMDAGDSYNRDKDLMASGACAQNMLLEASSLNLGSCWLGEILNKKKEVCAFLRLDSDLELLAVIALGRPNRAAKARAKSCRKPLRQLVLQPKLP
ncbi:MAG: nitroreductase family protein [Candidatus Omnitrophota bacterium]